MTAPVIEPCPRCSRTHERGDYLPHQEGGHTVVGPHDIHCRCGLLLRWSVPIFKLTESGYVLRVLRDNETPFLPPKQKENNG
jgi:hypothetical protein